MPDKSRARTIDGAQGGTWDQVHLLATPNVDRHTLYVGQSRGRNPTHTWNVVPGPDDEIHGNVVTDDRGPDEIILGAAARRPDIAFASWDDPNVVDRQLRAERAEHEHALAAGPPDRSNDVAALTRRVEQLTRDARTRWDALERADKHTRPTSGPHLRRRTRDAHRHAVDAEARARAALVATRDDLRAARADLAGAESGDREHQRWEAANQWRRDEIARIDDRLDRHWAETVLDAALDGDPLAYGLDHLRHAAHTLSDDPSQPDHYEILRAALEDQRRDRVNAIYRGDRAAPDHLVTELGPVPEPGPGRAVWDALALRIEERADFMPAEPARELSLLERRWAQLGQPDPISPDRLIAAVDRLPLGRLTEAGPAEWTAVLDQATEVHRQLAEAKSVILGYPCDVLIGPWPTGTSSNESAREGLSTGRE